MAGWQSTLGPSKQTARVLGMTVLNGLDRFHLVQGVVDRVPKPASVRQSVREAMEAKLLQHHAYIRVHGQDMPEILKWQWHQSPPIAG